MLPNHAPSSRVVFREKVLGSEHPSVVESLEAYADLLSKMGRKGEAADVRARVQAIPLWCASLEPSVSQPLA